MSVRGNDGDRTRQDSCQAQPQGGASAARRTSRPARHTRPLPSSQWDGPCSECSHARGRAPDGLGLAAVPGGSPTSWGQTMRATAGQAMSTASNSSSTLCTGGPISMCCHVGSCYQPCQASGVRPPGGGGEAASRPETDEVEISLTSGCWRSSSASRSTASSVSLAPTCLAASTSSGVR
jgi:hypothetical protein